MYCTSSLMQTIDLSTQWGQSNLLLFMWAHLVTWHTHTPVHLTGLTWTHTPWSLLNSAFLSLFSITVDDSGFMCVHHVPLQVCPSLFSSSNLSLQEIKACFRLSQTGRGLWDMLGVLNLWSGCCIKLLQFMPDQKPSTATWDHTHAHAYERNRKEQSRHTQMIRHYLFISISALQ